MVELGQVVWLLESHKLMGLPKIGQGGQKRSRVFGQRVGKPLVDNVTDDG